MDRPWQNWQQGRVASRVDSYWRNSLYEIALRDLMADDLAGLLVPGLIMDVGCGSGLLYAALRDSGALATHDYLGGDITPAMLDLARAIYPTATFRRLDVLDLGYHFAPNVICASVLQHLPSFRPALRELCRVSTGLVYVVTWLHTAPERIFFGPDEDAGEGHAFYQNIYNLADVSEFARALPGVQSVVTRAFDNVNQALIITKKTEAGR